MQPRSRYWRKQLAIASVYSLVLQAMAGGLVSGVRGVPAHAAELMAWQFNPANTELEITVPGGVTPRYFILAEPARIVVDLPNTQLGTVMAEQAYSGLVRQIRVNQFEPGLTRIVLELSPDAEFAEGQVELQRMAESSQGDRWVVRPLLVGGTSPIAPTLAYPPVSTSQPPAAPIAPVESPRLEAAPPLPAPAPIAGAPITVTPITPPPLEPGALEIPVQPAPVEPTATPPATPAEDAPAVAIDPVPITTSSPSSPAPEIQEALPSAPSPIALVEFGQPLPAAISAATRSPQADPVPGAEVAATRDRSIPAGTVLPLRYSGTVALQLQVNVPWQEVLLLDQPLLDDNGDLIAPAGSPVIGQFELTEDGSIFTARAIVLEGRNVRLDAATDTIEPRSNLIQPNQVIEAQLSNAARLSE